MTNDVIEKSTTLERGALGLVPVLFQAMTTAGPAVSVASSFVFAASYAGGSTPLTAVLATVMILLVAISIGQMGRHLPSAGGLYTYTTAGLGKGIGFLIAWTVWFAYLIDLPVIFLIFVYLTQANLVSHLNAPSIVWVPTLLIVVAAVNFLVLRGIKLSTRTGVVLGTIEIVIFLAFALTMIGAAGSNNTLSVFAPGTGNQHGFASVFVAAIYGILAFVGFDAAAPIAEETKHPRRVVPRALVGSIIITGLFYTLLMYAAVVYWGPNAINQGSNQFVAFNGGDPFDGIAAKLWGGAWFIVLLAILNSTFASVLGATNGAVRIGYSLGRIRILPDVFARVHRRYRTPWVMILAQALVAVVISLVLGFLLGSPANAFAFLGAVVTILFVPIYGLSALSCLFYYRTKRPDEFNWLLHGVVPVVALLLFVPILLGGLGIDFAGLGIAPLTGAARFAPPIAIGWIVLGVIAYFIFQRNQPESTRQLDRIFLDEIPESSPVGPGPRPAGVVDR